MIRVTLYMRRMLGDTHLAWMEVDLELIDKQGNRHEVEALVQRAFDKDEVDRIKVVRVINGHGTPHEAAHILTDVEVRRYAGHRWLHFHVMPPEMR